MGKPRHVERRPLDGERRVPNVLARRISQGGGTYKDLADVLLNSFGKVQTPDGVSFMDPALDVAALDECMEDL